MEGITTTDLDPCKTQVMTSPSLLHDFASTFELYATFIKKMTVENHQLNVSDVSFACRQGGGNNSFGKRSPSGTSNVSNAVVDDRFFEKHAYHALTPD
jgi:hypothetical protein